MSAAVPPPGCDILPAVEAPVAWQARLAKAFAVGVLLIFVIAPILWTAQLLAERHCLASGGKWQFGECRPLQTECRCGARRIPVGAAFGDGCNGCECLPHGWKCTTRGCLDEEGQMIGGCFKGVKPAEPCRDGATGCIYDPGCDPPRSYAGGVVSAMATTYCGCDGMSFTAFAPHRPYRHVGECRPGVSTVLPVPTAVPPWRPAVAGLARFLERTQQAALWSYGPLLGTMDLRTATNVAVVTMPRHESVVCAARSDDASLLGAISSAGSVALWTRDGSLLADYPGSKPVESCSRADFEFAPATRRVLIELVGRPPVLIGERLGVVIRGPDPNLPVTTEFSADGTRVFTDTEVYDALTGKFRDEPREQRDVSPDGKFFARSLRHNVHLYAADSDFPIVTLGGKSLGFRADLLLVDEDAENLADEVTTAYALEPFARRWQRRGIALWFAAPGELMRPEHGDWNLGMSSDGYTVFDVRTGDTLATWRSSGFACGYQWSWEKDALVFIEGDLLTFWNQQTGVKSHRSECEGALQPIFSADRSRMIGLDGVWDMTRRERLTRLEMPQGGGVWGFSHDERLILGVAAVGRALDASIVAWDAATGRVAWQRKPAGSSEDLPEVAWPFVDERDGRLFNVAHLIDGEGHLELIVFDDVCRGGPRQLPDGVKLPQRHCPELAETFGRMARTRLHSALR